MSAPNTTRQPNILLITTDQQRFDTVGRHKPDWMRTPHLDDLARRGITFNRAYSDCPICVPARTTIMSGQHALRHGMTRNGATSAALNDARTLPTRLRALGYQTMAIGKMHFGPPRARHGFDECLISNDYHTEMLENGEPLRPMRHGMGQCEMQPTLSTVPESMTFTNWTAEQCTRFIRERRDPTRPYFLWCSFSKPHPPIDPPEPYYSMYRDCDIPEPVYGDWASDENVPPVLQRLRQWHSYDLITKAIWRESRAAYYGLITQIDHNIGRLYAALQDMKHADDRETIIVFTADHGEYLGDHWAAHKGPFHEVSAHVPFIMRLPDSWRMDRHGTECDELVCLADLLPTFVSAAGGRADDEHVDGLDLTAVLRGQRAGREYLEATAHDQPDEPAWYWAITDGRWKYMWYPEGACEQLFDLERDPRELHNRALDTDAGSTEAKQRLRAEMIRRHEARGSSGVADGGLVSMPVGDDTERDRRARAWHGHHTEWTVGDVKH